MSEGNIQYNTIHVHFKTLPPKGLDTPGIGRGVTTEGGWVQMGMGQGRVLGIPKMYFLGERRKNTCQQIEQIASDHKYEYLKFSI